MTWRAISARPYHSYLDQAPLAALKHHVVLDRVLKPSQPLVTGRRRAQGPRAPEPLAVLIAVAGPLTPPASNLFLLVPLVPLTPPAPALLVRFNRCAGRRGARPPVLGSLRPRQRALPLVIAIVTVRVRLPLVGVEPVGRGLHSSTSQLNLSRSCH